METLSTVKGKWSTIIVFIIVTIIKIVGGKRYHFSINATKAWQVIKSPRFPSRFEPDTQATWRLTAPARWRVKLQFMQFSFTEPDHKGNCAWQWLTVINGDHEEFSEKYGLKVCGKQSPGTLISTGRQMRINLYSTRSASGQEYIGFQASFSMTQENPILPGLDITQLLSEGSRSSSSSSISLPRDTIGSALDRLNPNRSKNPKRRLSQSEKIEEMNRRRNNGLVVGENPIFNGNGELQRSRRILSTSPQPTTSPALQNIPRRKRSYISPQIRTVLIVIGIITAIFFLLIFLKKCGFFAFLSRCGKENSDAEQRAGGNFSQRKMYDVAKYVEDNERNQRHWHHREKPEKYSNGGDRKHHHHHHKHHRHHHRHKEDANHRSKNPISIKTISKKGGVGRQHKHHYHKHGSKRDNTNPSDAKLPNEKSDKVNYNKHKTAHENESTNRSGENYRDHKQGNNPKRTNINKVNRNVKTDMKKAPGKSNYTGNQYEGSRSSKSNRQAKDKKQPKHFHGDGSYTRYHQRKYESSDSSVDHSSNSSLSSEDSYDHKIKRRK